MKKIILFLSCLAAIAVLTVIFYQPGAERFFCEHCHRTVVEKPAFIAEQSVDVTVCSDCHQDYLKGVWRICPN